MKNKIVFELKKITLVVILGLAYFCSIFFSEIISPEDDLGYTNSIVSIAVFLSICWLLSVVSRQKWTDEWRTALPLAMIFSMLTVCGAKFNRYAFVISDGVNLADVRLYLSIAAFAIIYASLILLLWRFLDKEDFSANKGKPRYASIIEAIHRKHSYFALWALIFLSWVPVQLALYPGLFSYDSGMQYRQFHYGDFQSQHPVVHTLFLGFLVDGTYQFTGDYNLSVYIYLVVQMLMVSAALAYIAKRLFLEAPFWCGVLAMIYYSLFPTIALFAMCSTKDVLFSVFVMLYFVLLRDVFLSPEKEFRKPTKMISIIVVAVLMCLLRSNAIYAFVAAIPFVICCAKRFQLKCSLMLLVILTIYFPISISLNAIYDGYPSLAPIKHFNLATMMGVPLQQLARVYTVDINNYSQEDLITLKEIIPPDPLASELIGSGMPAGIDNYHPKRADNVSYVFQTEAFLQDPGKYISLWARTGIRHPQIYVNALLHNTVDGWYPNSLVNGYLYDVDSTELAKHRTNYLVDYLSSPAYFDSKINWLGQFYLGNFTTTISFQKIPVISMLFSPGFHFWFFLLVLFYAAHRKKKAFLISCVFILLLVATNFLGPMMLVRFFLYLFFLFPVFLESLVGGKSALATKL